MKLLRIILHGFLSLLLVYSIICYTKLIQYELSSSTVNGQIKIVASTQRQYIEGIKVNGKFISSENFTKNDWHEEKVDVVSEFYLSNSENDTIYIQPHSNIKTISFEHNVTANKQKIDVYIDDHLIKSIDTSFGNMGRNIAYIELEQQFHITKENAIWYLHIIVFVLGVFVFITRGLFWKIRTKHISLLLVLTLAQNLIISITFPLFINKHLVLFNSTFTRVQLHVLVTLFSLLSFTAMFSIHRSKNRLVKRFGNILRFTSYVALPFLALFILENSYSQFSQLSNESLQANLIILGSIYILLAIALNFHHASIILLLASLAIGLVNKVMIDSRGTPLLYYNLFQVEDGMNVASNLSIYINNKMLQSIILSTLLFCYYNFLSSTRISISQKYQNIKFGYNIQLLKRSIRILCVLLLLFSYSSFIEQVVNTSNITLNRWKMFATYGEYGLPLSLASFYEDSKLSKPKGYTNSTLENVFEKYPTETVKQEIQPNIIFIQNESQADFSKLKGINLQPNPLANQLSLKDNAIHGSLNVSVFGGGTANTEYEVLTSNPISLLSSNLFPYQQIINQERPSFATYLQNQEYNTVAMHPQSGNNYNRKTVYPLLGFNESYFLDSEPSIDTLSELTTERNWPSDQFLFNNLKELYSTKGNSPLFSFVVTMQGHGGYISNENIYPREVSINGSTSNYLAETEFLTSMKHTDEAFADLISFFSTYKEPTVIVMYGDHQPSLSQEFYSQFMNTDNPSAKYTTPFVIWANFDIPKREKATISPNYLVPYLMSILSESKYPLPRTGYHQFLEEAQKTLPILTSWGNLDSAGKSIDNIKEIPLYQTYLQLEYNNAVDKRTKLEFFE
ncbi:TPA: LTA synthase family protein [Streptococcus suis]